MPLPVKTRPGVAIPQSQQRARRQVQIFHSQPLSSPRSAGRVRHRLDNSSGSNSVSSSYVAQMQLSRMSNGSSGNSFSKVQSGLASSLEEKAPFGEKVAQAFAAKGVTGVPTKLVDSPSTSSSSSSISSTTAGSSTLNTPPTSHSVSNLKEFIGIAPLESNLRTGPKISPAEPKVSEEERKGLAIPSKKVTDLESELCSAMSSSWKDHFLSSGSPGKTGLAHPRSRSGLSNPKSWKDPGTGAPAPAVLVSAVVGADGLEDGLTKVSLVDVQTVVPSAASSATTTVVRPSPVGTPLPMSARKFSTPALDALPSNDTLSRSSNMDSPSSLLSQTAPRPISLSNRSLVRNSPPQQVSQLSAHMHLNKPALSCGCMDASNNHGRFVESTVIDPATANISSVPSAPPPTPMDASLVPETHSGYISCNSCNSHLDTCIGIQPPISIKIADLGNATPSTKHFTEDIQTRQYRAPEAILGRRDWDARVDIWSACCVVSVLGVLFLFFIVN